MQRAPLVLSLLTVGCTGGASSSADLPAPREAGVEASAGPIRTVMAGAFTESQATRGQQGFARNCASCHAINQFSGSIFQRIWANRPVGTLFEIVTTSMPQNDPGGLNPGEYADIVAFLLRENGYPAGNEELPPDSDPLNDLLFVPLPSNE